MLRGDISIFKLLVVFYDYSNKRIKYQGILSSLEKNTVYAKIMKDHTSDSKAFYCQVLTCG